MHKILKAKKIFNLRFLKSNHLALFNRIVGFVCPDKKPLKTMLDIVLHEIATILQKSDYQQIYMRFRVTFHWKLISKKRTLPVVTELVGSVSEVMVGKWGCD